MWSGIVVHTLVSGRQESQHAPASAERVLQREMGVPPLELAILVDTEHALSLVDVPPQERFDPLARQHHTGNAVPREHDAETTNIELELTDIRPPCHLGREALTEERKSDIFLMFCLSAEPRNPPG